MKVVQQELFPTAPLHSDGPFLTSDIDVTIGLLFNDGEKNKFYVLPDDRSEDLINYPSKEVPRVHDAFDWYAPQMSDASLYLQFYTDGPSGLCRCVEIDKEMVDELDRRLVGTEEAGGDITWGDEEENYLCFNFTKIGVTNEARTKLLKLRDDAMSGKVSELGEDDLEDTDEVEVNPGWYIVSWWQSPMHGRESCDVIEELPPAGSAT